MKRSESGTPAAAIAGNEHSGTCKFQLHIMCAITKTMARMAYRVKMPDILWIAGALRAAPLALRLRRRCFPQPRPTIDRAITSFMISEVPP
jgi:hypothetical protein